MNVYLPNWRLPSAYQEVEYIQSSWTQFINTWVNGTFSTSMNFDYKFTLVQNPPSWQYAILWDKNSSWQWLTMYFDYSSPWNLGTWCGSWTTYTTWSVTVWAVTIVNATFNKTKWRTIIINGTTYSNSTIANNVTTNSDTFWIGSDKWATWSSVWYFKIYYFKITKDWTLVRDFIPCYRKSDNVIWLYDLVNSAFYTNSWTGTFSKGNDVTMAVLKNAYIGLWPIDYTIPTFKSADAWNFLQVAQNWYTVKSVIAEWTITYKSEYSSWYTWYIWISDNSSWTKVWRLLMRVNNNPYLAINFRINWTQNELTLISSWIVANGTNKYKIKFTRTGYELTVNWNSTSWTRSTSYAWWAADIFNSSTFNVYSWAIWTENSQKFTVEYQ